MNELKWSRGSEWLHEALTLPLAKGSSVLKVKQSLKQRYGGRGGARPTGSGLATAENQRWVESVFAVKDKERCVVQGANKAAERRS